VFAARFIQCGYYPFSDSTIFNIAFIFAGFTFYFIVVVYL